jgi:alginate biosynthesis protein Alg44
MNNTTHTIVHEAEVQRQHMRLQLPIKVEIKGHMFEVADWSHQGIALYVKPLLAHNINLKKDDLIDITLVYAFSGFSLNMPMQCEVRHISSDGTKAGCRFHGLSERNISLLHYLVSAYIAGDMVHIGDVLDVVSRKNFTTARKLPTENISKAEMVKRKMRKGINMLLLLILAISVLGYSGLNLYERLCIVQAKVATVVPNLSFTESNTSYIEATVSYNDAIQLKKGMKATLGFPAYDTYLDGTIEQIIMEGVQEDTARILIVPSKTIPDAWMRIPVEVKIDTWQ